MHGGCQQALVQTVEYVANQKSQVSFDSFAGRLWRGSECSVLVKAEIHELRGVAISDCGWSVRLLDLFKFEIDFPILMDGAQQIAVHLGARFFRARRIRWQRITHGAGGSHDPAR